MVILKCPRVKGVNMGDREVQQEMSDVKYGEIKPARSYGWLIVAGLVVLYFGITMLLNTKASAGVYGIGVTISRNENANPSLTGIVLNDIADNSPADQAELRSRDLILEIDDRSTYYMTGEEAAALIRGPKGTTVSLLVLRIYGMGPPDGNIPLLRPTIVKVVRNFKIPPRDQ